MADILATYLPQQDHLYSAVLADILDGLGHRTSALPSELRPLKPQWRVFGRVVTLNVIPVAEEPKQPYAVELDCIDALKPGDVLVATTNGDRGSGLWGELLSTSSKAHGARGAIIDGLTRDALKIMSMDFPVFAAGFSPLDSKGRIDGISFGKPIRIGDCVIHSGDFVFADFDGIVVVPADLAEKALPLALDKVKGENTVRDELARGRSAREVFEEYGIL